MKFAVIGLGSIGLTHLDGLEIAKNCELSAVCDINEEVAKEYAEKYQVPYFTDYKQIPGNCDADGVILNLPHWLHCEVTEYFLDKGFHVLVEKPMANTPDECRRMIAARDRSGKKLAVAHPQGFSHANRMVKKIYESGELGKLCMITEYRSANYFADSRPRWFLNKKLSGGGIVMNFGAHALDKFMYITGSNPKTVSGTVANFKNDFDIEGHAQISLILENGIPATISFIGYLSSGYEDYFYFTDGVLKIVNTNHLYRLVDGQWIKVEVPERPTFIELELEAFERYVNGQDSEIPTAEYGAIIIDAIDRIYKGE